MKKKLKIQFWKAEHALAMQVLEQEGLPEIKEEGHIKIMGHPDLDPDCIYLRGDTSERNLEVSIRSFVLNSDRDIYLTKMVNAITNELFALGGELKVGEMCEVSDHLEGPWRKRKLIAILPDNYRSRFIAQSDNDRNDWFNYEYAIPICKRIEPKIEVCGNIVTYTWEEE